MSDMFDESEGLIENAGAELANAIVKQQAEEIREQVQDSFSSELNSIQQQTAALQANTAAQRQLNKEKSNSITINQAINNAIQESLKQRNEMLVYHGSKADFEQFNPGYIGTGAGGSVNGTGFNFSNSKRISSAYAKFNQSFKKDNSYNTFLYSAAIPRDNGENYLDWDKYFSTRDMIKKMPSYEAKNAIAIGNSEITGGRIYENLAKNLGTDITHEILKSLGFIGTKASAKTVYNGATDNEVNYTLFPSENDNIRILSQEKTDVIDGIPSLESTIKYVDNSLKELADAFKLNANVIKDRKVALNSGGNTYNIAATPVNDLIITKDGRAYVTDDADNIIATKELGSGNINSEQLKQLIEQAMAEQMAKNGEMVVYHGTDAKFDNIKFGQNGGTGQAYMGKGIYGTSNNNIAAWYAAHNLGENGALEQAKRNLSEIEKLKQEFDSGKIIDRTLEDINYEIKDLEESLRYAEKGLSQAFEYESKYGKDKFTERDIRDYSETIKRIKEQDIPNAQRRYDNRMSELLYRGVNNSWLASELNGNKDYGSAYVYSLGIPKNTGNNYLESDRDYYFSDLLRNSTDIKAVELFINALKNATPDIETARQKINAFINNDITLNGKSLNDKLLTWNSGVTKEDFRKLGWVGYQYNASDDKDEAVHTKNDKDYVLFDENDISTYKRTDVNSEVKQFTLDVAGISSTIIEDTRFLHMALKNVIDILNNAGTDLKSSGFSLKADNQIVPITPTKVNDLIIRRDGTAYITDSLDEMIISKNFDKMNLGGQVVRYEDSKGVIEGRLSAADTSLLVKMTDGLTNLDKIAQYIPILLKSTPAQQYVDSMSKNDRRQFMKEGGGDILREENNKKYAPFVEDKIFNFISTQLEGTLNEMWNTGISEADLNRLSVFVNETYLKLFENLNAQAQTQLIASSNGSKFVQDFNPFAIDRGAVIGASIKSQQMARSAVDIQNKFNEGKGANPIDPHKFDRDYAQVLPLFGELNNKLKDIDVTYNIEQKFAKINEAITFTKAMLELVASVDPYNVKGGQQEIKIIQKDLERRSGLYKPATYTQPSAGAREDLTRADQELVEARRSQIVYAKHLAEIERKKYEEEIKNWKEQKDDSNLNSGYSSILAYRDKEDKPWEDLTTIKMGERKTLKEFTSRFLIGKNYEFTDKAGPKSVFWYKDLPVFSEMGHFEETFKKFDYYMKTLTGSLGTLTRNEASGNISFKQIRDLASIRDAMAVDEDGNAIGDIAKYKKLRSYVAQQYSNFYNSGLEEGTPEYYKALNVLNTNMQQLAKVEERMLPQLRDLANNTDANKLGILGTFDRVAGRRGEYMQAGYSVKNAAISTLLGPKLGNVGLGKLDLAFQALRAVLKRYTQSLQDDLNNFSQIQSLQVRLGTIYGDQAAADEMFDEIKQYAQKSPFGIQAMTEMAVQLKQSGVYAIDLLDTLKMIGDASGDNAEKMKRVANNYAQIVANGKATTRDLREFANAGIPIYRALQEVKGTTSSEIYKLTSQGEIKFKDIEKAFQKMTSEGGVFNNAVEKSSKTYLARKQNLEDAKQIAKAARGEYRYNKETLPGWFTQLAINTREAYWSFIGDLYSGYDKNLAIEKEKDTNADAAKKIEELKEKRNELYGTNNDSEIEKIEEEIKALESSITYEKQMKAAYDYIIEEYKDVYGDDYLDEIKKEIALVSQETSADGLLNKLTLSNLYIRDTEANKFSQMMEKWYNDVDSLYSFVSESNSAFEQTSVGKYEKQLRDKAKWDERFNSLNTYRSYIDERGNFTSAWSQGVKDVYGKTNQVNTVETMLDMFEKGFFITSKSITVSLESLSNNFEDEAKRIENNNNWDEIKNNFTKLATLNFSNDNIKTQIEILQKILEEDNTEQTVKKFVNKLSDFRAGLEKGAAQGNKEASKLLELLPFVFQYLETYQGGKSFAEANGKVLSLRTKGLQTSLNLDSDFIMHNAGISQSRMFDMYMDNMRATDISTLVKSYLAAGNTYAGVGNMLSYSGVKNGYGVDSLNWQKTQNSLESFALSLDSATSVTSAFVQQRETEISALDEFVATMITYRNSGDDIYDVVNADDLKSLAGTIYAADKNAYELLIEETADGQIKVKEGAIDMAAAMADNMRAVQSLNTSFVNLKSAVDNLNLQSISMAATVFYDNNKSTYKALEGLSDEVKKQFLSTAMTSLVPYKELFKTADIFEDIDISGKAFGSEQEKEYFKTEKARELFIDTVLKTFEDQNNFRTQKQAEYDKWNKFNSLGNKSTYQDWLKSGLSDPNVKDTKSFVEMRKSGYFNRQEEAAKAWMNIWDGILELLFSSQNFSKLDAEIKRKDVFPLWQRIINKFTNVNLSLFKNKDITAGGQAINVWKSQQNRDVINSTFKAMLGSMSTSSALSKLLVYSSPAYTNWNTSNVGTRQIDWKQTAKNAMKEALSTTSSVETTKAYVDSQKEQLEAIKELLAGAFTMTEDAENLYDENYQASMGQIADKLSKLDENVFSMAFSEQEINGEKIIVFEESTIEATNALLEQKEAVLAFGNVILQTKESIEELDNKIRQSNVHRDTYLGKYNNIEALNGLPIDRQADFINKQFDRAFNDSVTRKWMKANNILSPEDYARAIFGNEDVVTVDVKSDADEEALKLSKELEEQLSSKQKIFDSNAESFANTLSKLENDRALKVAELEAIEVDFDQKFENAIVRFIELTDKNTENPDWAGYSEEIKRSIAERDLRKGTAKQSEQAELIKLQEDKNLKQLEIDDIDALIEKETVGLEESNSELQKSIDALTDSINNLNITDGDYGFANVKESANKELEKTFEDVVAERESAAAQAYKTLFDRKASPDKGIYARNSLMSAFSEYDVYGNNSRRQQRILDYMGLEKGTSYEQWIADLTRNGKINSTAIELGQSLSLGTLSRYNKDNFRSYLKDGLARGESKDSIIETWFKNGTKEEGESFIEFIGNAIDATDKLNDSLINLSRQIESTFVNGIADGFTNTMKQCGKDIMMMNTSLKTSEDYAKGYANIWKNVAQSMLDSIGPALTQAGLSMIINNPSMWEAGLAMIAAGGVLSLTAGMFDKSEKSEKEQQEARLKNLRDLLVEIIDQAKIDAEYYAKNARHQDALSEVRSMSVNDAIIAPNGNVITTAPDDYLIATKTPGSLVGGRGNVVVNFSMIDQSTGAKVETRSVNQKQNTDGSIDIVAVVGAIMDDRIANGEADGAFAAREQRISGKHYVY